MKRILLSLLIFFSLCCSVSATTYYYVAVHGQSNAYWGWSAASLTGTDSGTPDARCHFSINGTTWTATPYNAALNFCNTLVASSKFDGKDIRVLMYGVPGAALNSASKIDPYGYWLGTGSTWWPTFQTYVTNAGGVMDADVWIQGETEGQFGDGGNYQTDLGTFFGQIRTGVGASTKIIVAGLNNYLSTTLWNGIRTKQQAACTADGGAKFVDMSDLGVGVLHYSATDHATVGTRLANALLTEQTVTGGTSQTTKLFPH